MDAPLKPSINRSFPARQGAASSTKRLCRPNRGCKLLDQLMYFSIVCRERTALRIGKTLGSCGGERASPIGLPFSALADLAPVIDMPAPNRSPLFLRLADLAPVGEKPWFARPNEPCLKHALSNCIADFLNEMNFVWLRG